MCVHIANNYNLRPCNVLEYARGRVSKMTFQIGCILSSWSYIISNITMAGLLYEEKTFFYAFFVFREQQAWLAVQRIPWLEHFLLLYDDSCNNNKYRLRLFASYAGNILHNLLQIIYKYAYYIFCLYTTILLLILLSFRIRHAKT